LTRLLSQIPGDFPAPIVVVQHLDPRYRSLIAEILDRRTALQVVEAGDGDRLQAGHVYTAPPDRHLLVNADGSVSLTQSELVHFVRPSADLLFESVAASYRDHAIALVLTGSGSDGGMGVEAIKKMGGTVIAQDEASSQFFGMPGTAIATGCVDFVLSLDEIAPALGKLMDQETDVS
jgi:two-component system chemotaxis response regulator CheB